MAMKIGVDGVRLGSEEEVGETSMLIVLPIVA